MSEMQRVNTVLESKGRRAAWTIAVIVLLVASLGLNVGLWWQAHERAMAAEEQAASLAQQVQAECEAGGELSVDGADLCARADDVAEHTAEVTIGPEGPPGPTGSPGPTGPAGPRGTDGQDGAAGAAGATGAAGPAGTDGIDGQAGADGATGPAGPQGETGATGETGPQGETGATGPAGPSGPVCSTGYVESGQLEVLTRGDDGTPAWRTAVLCIPTTEGG